MSRFGRFGIVLLFVVCALLCFALVIVMILGVGLAVVASLSYNEEEGQEIMEMFDSFENSQDYILVTRYQPRHQLVLDGVHHDLSDMKYNGRTCNILFIEENGFYSYTYDYETLTVEFLFTRYEDFETTLLGTDVVPSHIINDSGSYCDRCFWFRMDDPQVEEFKQIIYSWNIDTKQAKIVDCDAVSRKREESMDNNRSEKYSFQRKDGLFKSDLYVTDNETGVTKKLNKSLLDTFEEGRKIKKKLRNTAGFGINQTFVKGDDIYLASILIINSNGKDNCYWYIFKWNFETEECTYFTAAYFESYQKRVVDMYIR